MYDMFVCQCLTGRTINILVKYARHKQYTFKEFGVRTFATFEEFGVRICSTEFMHVRIRSTYVRIKSTSPNYSYFDYLAILHNLHLLGTENHEMLMIKSEELPYQRVPEIVTFFLDHRDEI